MNDNKDNLEQYLSDVDFDDTPDHAHRDLLEQKLLLNFNDSSTRHNMKWRAIMNNKITKTAVAALMVVAVLAGINMFGKTSSIALAEVLDKVMQIKAYAYNMRTTDEVSSGYTEFQMLASKDFGGVSKAYVQDEQTGQMKLFSANYATSSDGIIVTLIPEQKLFIEIKIGEEMLEATEKLLEETGQDAASPIFFLEEFIKDPVIYLGSSTIDGVKVVGFESTDIAATEDAGRTEARIWIDVETELPVKLEAETYDQSGNLVSKMTTDNFQWDLSVTQEDFTPVIPDDYTKLDDQLEFSGDEKSVISALQFYSKIFEGKYPESLAVKTLTLSTQIENALKAGAGAMYAGMPQDLIMKEVGQGCMDLEFTVVFHGMVASQNKAMAYYGDKVSADNPDAVLMRWRNDDGRYMVIFGDLTIKQVTEESLAELEAMPIK